MKMLIIQIISYVVLQVFLNAYHCYYLRCPKAKERYFRSMALCGSVKNYFCLYNAITRTYDEGCGHLLARKGSRFIISGQRTRTICPVNSYQPINFTNEFSDCLYHKNLCNEEGQIIFKSGKHFEDTFCGCDHTQGFAVVLPPKKLLFCNSSIHEDCTCYRKKCRTGSSLLSDFECSQLQGEISMQVNEKKIKRTPVEEKKISTKGYNFVWRHMASNIVSVALIFLNVFVVVFFSRKFIEKCFRKALRKRSLAVQRVGEIKFLQLLSFLHHVATPLVRKQFDRKFLPSTFTTEMGKLIETINENYKIEFYHRKHMKSASSKDLDLLLMVELLWTDKSFQKQFRVLEIFEEVFISMNAQSRCFLTDLDFKNKGHAICKALQILSPEPQEYSLFYTMISEAEIDHNELWMKCLKKRIYLSSEKNNFLKIVYLLFKVARPAVKDIYDEMEKRLRAATRNQYNTPMTKRELKQKIFESVLKRAANDPHLTRTEFDFLVNKADSSSADLSLKLLVYIIRSKQYTRGMTTKDHPENQALISLDKIRVETTYSSTGRLSNKKFMKTWNEIQQDLNNLGVGHYLDEFTWLQNSDNLIMNLRSV